MPNQYAKVKHAVKGEEEAHDETEHNYGFIDEFLEDTVNSENMYVSQDDTGCDYWSSECACKYQYRYHSAQKLMSLLFLPDSHHLSILDCGADTCVLGKGKCSWF
jgi:hypothetical protein